MALQTCGPTILVPSFEDWSALCELLLAAGRVGGGMCSLEDPSSYFDSASFPAICGIKKYEGGEVYLARARKRSDNFADANRCFSSKIKDCHWIFTKERGFSFINYPLTWQSRFDRSGSLTAGNQLVAKRLIRLREQGGIL